MQRIVFFHLYNDYSGSPKVLSLIIRDLVAKGYTIELFTSKTQGFLSDLEGVRYHNFTYCWSTNKLKTIFLLLYAQSYIFFSSFRFLFKKNVIFYINTICPIGAVLAGKLCRKKIIYHVHEKYIDRNPLHKFYEAVWKFCSNDSVFVSEYVKQKYGKSYGKHFHVIYNTLSDKFLESASLHKLQSQRTILMICSLKKYKGIDQFVALAQKLTEYKFILILNATSSEISRYFTIIPRNLELLSTQADVRPFYKESDILLNLSLPDQWVETFGLTLVEAMAFGLPVIAPPVGGPVELVKDDFNGYLVDSRNLDLLEQRIYDIFDSDRYQRLSFNARDFARKFDEKSYIEKIESVIKNC